MNRLTDALRTHGPAAILYATAAACFVATVAITARTARVLADDAVQVWVSGRAK